MRLIDADEMASDESTAYMKAQIKTDRLTAMINEVVHKKIQMLIADTPTIDAVPVVHAYIVMKDGHKSCSVCGTRLSAVKQRYCPHCGAKMDGERK